MHLDKPYIKSLTVRRGVTSARIGGVGDYSVSKTFDCGQCFRFEVIGDTELDCEVGGVALGHPVTFGSLDGELVITCDNVETMLGTWLHYLALDEDYGALEQLIENALVGDDASVMKRAVAASHGIRILRQEPWETLCSFIISQNNNIPRIKTIISSLSRKFGTPLNASGAFSFPTAEALAKAGEEQLRELKVGFRAAYIANAARRVASGELELDELSRLGDYDAAKAALMTLHGVGPKVADCTLLFGLGYTEAFPIDTWMKKVAARHFPSGLDHTRFGRAAGLAQQYLFYMERYTSHKA